MAQFSEFSCRRLATPFPPAGDGAGAGGYGDDAAHDYTDEDTDTSRQSVRDAILRSGRDVARRRRYEIDMEA